MRLDWPPILLQPHILYRTHVQVFSSLRQMVVIKFGNWWKNDDLGSLVNFARVMLQFNSPITCKGVGLPLWTGSLAPTLPVWLTRRWIKITHQPTSRSRQTRSTFEAARTWSSANFPPHYQSLSSEINEGWVGGCTNNVNNKFCSLKQRYQSADWQNLNRPQIERSVSEIDSKWVTFPQ